MKYELNKLLEATQKRIDKKHPRVKYNWHLEIYSDGSGYIEDSDDEVLESFNDLDSLLEMFELKYDV